MIHYSGVRVLYWTLSPRLNTASRLVLMPAASKALNWQLLFSHHHPAAIALMPTPWSTVVFLSGSSPLFDSTEGLRKSTKLGRIHRIFWKQLANVVASIRVKSSLGSCIPMTKNDFWQKPPFLPSWFSLEHLLGEKWGQRTDRSTAVEAFLSSVK